MQFDDKAAARMDDSALLWWFENCGSLRLTEYLAVMRELNNRTKPESK